MRRQHQPHEPRSSHLLPFAQACYSPGRDRRDGANHGPPERLGYSAMGLVSSTLEARLKQHSHLTRVDIVPLARCIVTESSRSCGAARAGPAGRSGADWTAARFGNLSTLA